MPPRAALIATRTSLWCRDGRPPPSIPSGQESYFTFLSLRLCDRYWSLDRLRRFRRLSANGVSQAHCRQQITSSISRLCSGSRSIGLCMFYLSKASMSETCYVVGKISRYTIYLMSRSLKRGPSTRKRVVPNAFASYLPEHRVLVHGLSEKRPSIVRGESFLHSDGCTCSLQCSP